MALCPHCHTEINKIIEAMKQRELTVNGKGAARSKIVNVVGAFYECPVCRRPVAYSMHEAIAFLKGGRK